MVQQATGYEQQRTEARTGSRAERTGLPPPFFAKGASLKDPARLFNSSLDGNVRRAIDIHEGEEVDEAAFSTLVRQAVALNSSGKLKASKKAKP